MPYRFHLTCTFLSVPALLLLCSFPVYGQDTLTEQPAAAVVDSEASPATATTTAAPDVNSTAPSSAATEPAISVMAPAPPKATPSALPAWLSTPLDAEACVRIALSKNAQIAEVKASVETYRARLAQIESVFYPKITATGFIAPMFTVQGDAVHGVTRRYKSIKDWGPYTRLDAFLAQPLYTFGRAKAGKDAARERMEVERARVRETENMIALEVRRLYYLRLYAMSMLPALRSALETVEKAQDRGQELYDLASGDVTQVDLMRLTFGINEIKRYVLLAHNGAMLATSALKHTMGLPDDIPLLFAEERLPHLPKGEAQAEAAQEGATEATAPIPSLVSMMQKAAEQRPEWAQLAHGKQATIAWEKAEKLANLPIIALAGMFQAAWAPTRTDVTNPYQYDPFNQVFGGAALGLQWDFDLAKANAKAQEARAKQQEVEALARFAATGIPLQVRKAYQEVGQFYTIVGLEDESVTATRKWLAFAAAAYGTGAGPAKDVLEGLVAYLTAKRNHYESLQHYYIAMAELDYAVGIGAREE